MKYKDFSTDLLSKIKQALELRRKEGAPLVAAFDADGTLWDTDIGESFFDFLIDEQKVSMPDKPWDHYLCLVEQNPIDAYFWLCEILKGHPLAMIKKWAKEAIERRAPLPIFPQQKELIDFFHQNQVQVFVVTASIKWTVEPAAELLGISNSRVLGIETEVDPKGIITSNRIYPATYKTGKPEALLNATKGVAPFFSCGNSTGDTALLDSGKLSLAVKSSAKQLGLATSERELQLHALNKGWLIHHFV